MTKLQRKQWDKLCVSREETILKYFAKNSSQAPDGSFVMEYVLRAYDQGCRSERAKQKKVSK